LALANRGYRLALQDNPHLRAGLAEIDRIVAVLDHAIAEAGKALGAS
jgi:hypothetical protein